MALSQSALTELLEVFRAGEGVDLIRESVRVALQDLIELEASEVIGAGRYERSESRTTERNGSRPRVLTTKAGDVQLAIPKLRKGSFFPEILGHPVLWPLGAAAMEAAAQGDGSYVEEEALFDEGELHRLVEPGQAILCADSPARQLPSQWAGAVRGMERVSVVGAIPMGWGMGAACTTWPAHAQDRYTGPWNVTTRTPILLVNNRYDPNSPLTAARHVERLLGNAVLLVHDGYGHLTISDPSTCVTQVMGAYLVKLTTPPRGTHCASDRVPFDPAFGTSVS